MAEQKPSKKDLDKAIKSYTEQIEQAPNMREALKAYEAAGTMETIRDDLYPPEES